MHVYFICHPFKFLFLWKKLIFEFIYLLVSNILASEDSLNTRESCTLPGHFATQFTKRYVASQAIYNLYSFNEDSYKIVRMALGLDIRIIINSFSYRYVKSVRERERERISDMCWKLLHVWPGHLEHNILSCKQTLPRFAQDIEYELKSHRHSIPHLETL